MRTQRATVLAVAVTFMALAGAAKASGQEHLLGPVISSVAPLALTRSATAQVLTITGANFAAGLSLSVLAPNGQTVIYKGTAAIQMERDTAFKVSVVLAAPGTYTLIVTNPDGARSDPFVLKDKASSAPSAAPGATPKIDRVLPEQLTKDPQPQMISIAGQHFVQGLAVSLTDPIGTVYIIKGPALGSVTATSFTVSLTIEMTGDYTLMVTNPAGESSNSVTITAVIRRR